MTRKIEKTVRGSLFYNKADRLRASFDMDAVNSKLQSKAMVSFDRDVLPDDFSTELYEVVGSYVFTIELKKKG